MRGHFVGYAVAFVAGFFIVGVPLGFFLDPLPSWAGFAGIGGGVIGILIERRRLQWQEWDELQRD